MLYISLTLLSGIFSGILSIGFRNLELKRKIILMHKQFFTQITLFFVFFMIFQEFFSSILIDLGFIQLGWLLIYILFSSASFYAVQVFYEYFSKNKLFAPEEEVRIFLDKIEKEKK